MASPFAPRAQRATMYSKVGLETDVGSASPHRLVQMLFDGLFESMNLALAAIRNQDVALKNRQLSRAVRIVDEGLKSALNMEAGTLAADLNALYAYVCIRLTQANLRGDAEAIEECQRLMAPVREAWSKIGPSVTEQRAA
ncbi:flagellar export chaperone FliS [Pelomonas sp. KK5]|uniref:flagellar export chaperone FliS n=1 Tax=Pelomonas sp. KK5 TaxID=1855730 RepID=UPI001E2958D3|nr:flagellar export chaperone FliS [Pelomonas sp. KK5]